MDNNQIIALIKTLWAGLDAAGREKAMIAIMREPLPATPKGAANRNTAGKKPAPQAKPAPRTRNRTGGVTQGASKKVMDTLTTHGALTTGQLAETVYGDAGAESLHKVRSILSNLSKTGRIVSSGDGWMSSGTAATPANGAVSQPQV